MPKKNKTADEQIGLEEKTPIIKLDRIKVVKPTTSGGTIEFEMSNTTLDEVKQVITSLAFV